jgi:hypothetical protein
MISVSGELFWIELGVWILVGLEVAKLFRR